MRREARWTTFTLSEACVVVGGNTPSKKTFRYWSPPEVAWASPKDIKHATLTETADKVSRHALNEAGVTLVPRGSVLVVTRSGILAHTLPVTIAGIDTSINQDIKAILPQPSLDSRFLAYALRAQTTDILNQCRKEGTTVPSIDTTLFENFPLPLAPLAEQTRIADKLDALSLRMSDCKQRLAEVADVLRRFRQAVFHAGVSGALTAEWRRETKAAAWTDMQASEVCEIVQSGSTPKEGFEDRPGVPFLKVYNIVDQAIAFADRPQFVKASVHNGPLRRSRALPGDVLMNIVGPPLGKVAIIPDTYPEWNVNQALVIFRAGPRILPQWLYVLLCSGHNVDAIADETKGIAGQINISLSQCRNFVFPVPSLPEQSEVVARVAALLAYAVDAEARRTEALSTVKALWESALATAFAGKLVEPEPADIPSTVVRRRLISERTDAVAVRRRRRSTKRQHEIALEVSMLGLEEALRDVDGWSSAADVFRLCGAGDGAPTNRFEALYAELRRLRETGRILVRRVGDFDEIMLKE